MARNTIVKIDDTKDVIHDNIVVAYPEQWITTTGVINNDSLVSTGYRNRFDDRNYLKHRGLSAISTVTDYVAISGETSNGWTFLQDATNSGAFVFDLTYWPNIPTYNVVGINNEPSLTFNTSNLLIDTGDFLANPTFSMLGVFKLNSTGTSDGYLFDNGATTLYYDNSEGVLAFTSDGGNTIVSTNKIINTDTWNIFGLSRDADGEINIYLNESGNDSRFNNICAEYASAGIPKSTIQELLWYKFEETTGTDVVDSSSNGFNGVASTNISNLTILSGKTGRCFEFTAGEYINIGNIPDLTFDTNDEFSVAVWLKIDTLELGDIISKYDGSHGWGIVCEYAVGNRISFHDDHTGYASSGVFDSGGSTWVHLTVVYNNGTVAFYKNATFINSHTGLEISANNQNCYIANDIISSSAITSAQMDDFRIYNFALNAREINAIYNFSFGRTVSIHQYAYLSRNAYLASNYCLHDVAEVVVYDKFLNDDEMLAAYRTLKIKYNL